MRAAGTAVLLAISVVSAGEADERFLEGPEIRSLIVGQVTTGFSDRGRFWTEWHADGSYCHRLLVNDPDLPCFARGRWWIDGDLRCARPTTATWQYCRRIQRTGSNAYRSFTSDGALTETWSVAR